LVSDCLFNHLVNAEGILGAKEIYSHGWPSVRWL